MVVRFDLLNYMCSINRVTNWLTEPQEIGLIEFEIISKKLYGAGTITGM